MPEQPLIIHYTTKDHPMANGRRPEPGDQSWTFTFELADGTPLQLHVGRECREAFRSFILREELDDAADLASEQLT